MNWNILAAFLSAILAVIMWIMVYLFGSRKKKLPEKCSAHTEGRVIQYSSVSYGGIHIPLVEYTAGGNKYKIAGPKFSSAVVTKFSTPFSSRAAQIETNITSREELPKKLRVKIRVNSLAGGYISPLRQIYPLDSTVDVYYNPQNPKEAFVQRFEGVNKPMVGLFAVFAVLLTISCVASLLVPNMHP